MNIIPRPQKVDRQKGTYQGIFDIYFDTVSTTSRRIAAKRIQDSLARVGQSCVIRGRLTAPETGIYFTAGEQDGEGYRLTVEADKIVIAGESEQGLFYGAMSLAQMIAEYGIDLPLVTIEDRPDFAYRGFYHDATRGKVSTLDTYKALIDDLAYYKVNSFQLYTEHTFAYEGMHGVCTGRGYLTAEDIMELDQYCADRFVEMVPSQSLFGHLYQVLQAPMYKELCEYEDYQNTTPIWEERQRHHSLDASNPKSLQLVISMIDQLLPLFRTDKFNICCDETWDIGWGRNQKLREEIGEGKLYTGFVNKIISYLRSRGKKVMMWGDVINKNPDCLQDLPSDTTFLNWYYEIWDNEKPTRLFAEAGLTQYMCPGVSSWSRFATNAHKGFQNISLMIDLAVKYRASGILNTDWGDNGHVAHLGPTMLPVIFGAAKSWNAASATEWEDFCTDVSRQYYGDESGRFCHLISELGDIGELYIWGLLFCDVYRWREDFYAERVSVEACQKGYRRALEIVQEVKQLKRRATAQLSAYDELINEAHGVANALLTAPAFCGKPIIPGPELAARWESWLHEFLPLWRARNQESDVAEVSNFIRDLYTKCYDIN